MGTGPAGPRNGGNNYNDFKLGHQVDDKAIPQADLRGAAATTDNKGAPVDVAEISNNRLSVAFQDGPLVDTYGNNRFLSSKQAFNSALELIRPLV